MKASLVLAQGDVGVGTLLVVALVLAGLAFGGWLFAKSKKWI